MDEIIDKKAAKQRKIANLAIKIVHNRNFMP